MNTFVFLNNLRYSCSFSSLDNRVLTYVNFFGPSNAIVSRGSTTNISFSSALTRWRTMVAMRECEPRGEDYLRSFPLSVLVWIIGNIVV